MIVYYFLEKVNFLVFNPEKLILIYYCSSKISIIFKFSSKISIIFKMRKIKKDRYICCICHLIKSIVNFPTKNCITCKKCYSKNYNSGNTKKCATCNKVKNYSQFKSVRSHDGFSYDCKTCMKKQSLLAKEEKKKLKNEKFRRYRESFYERQKMIKSGTIIEIKDLEELLPFDENFIEENIRKKAINNVKGEENLKGEPSTEENIIRESIKEDNIVEKENIIGNAIEEIFRDEKLKVHLDSKFHQWNF